MLAVATLGILGLAFAGSLVGDDAGGDVAGLVPADEVVDDATTVEEAAAASGLPEAPVIEVTSVVGADGVEIDFDGAIDSRPVQASEVSLDALDTATEADGSVELPTTAPTEGAPDPTLSATPVVDPKTDWICEGPVRIEDPRQRRWRVTQIRFVDRGGYESVVLDLQRTGGSDAATNATARSFPTADIEDVIPRASQPGAGRTTVGVNLADGFAGVVDVDGYRPRGMDVVKEVSTYPSRGSAWVAISTAGDGCFRINSPAWRRSAATDTAILTIDVRR